MQKTDTAVALKTNYCEMSTVIAQAWTLYFTHPTKHKGLSSDTQVKTTQPGAQPRDDHGGLGSVLPGVFLLLFLLWVCTNLSFPVRSGPHRKKRKNAASVGEPRSWFISKDGHHPFLPRWTRCSAHQEVGSTSLPCKSWLSRHLPWSREHSRSHTV